MTSLRRLRLVLPILLSFVLFGARCGPTPSAPLAAQPGTPDYQRLAELPIPGGSLQVAGGALRVPRRDLEIDTRVGTHAIGARYDSALGAWRWSFELEHRDGRFTDSGGAVFETAALAAGDPIAGSVWQLEAGGSIATRSGLVHHFRSDGGLDALHWRGAAYPRLVLSYAEFNGEPQVIEIRQHTTAETSTPVYSLARDASGRLQAIEDRAGRRAEFAWQGDRLVQARDALDLENGWPGFRYEYAGALLSAVTNSEGERVEFEHSEGRLRVARSMGETDRVWAFEYLPKAADGLYTTRSVDPLGGVWLHRYDALRRLHERGDPGGAGFVYTWDGVRPATATDPAGVTTSWVWQGDDPVEEQQASGNRVLFTWEPAGIHRGEPSRRALARAEDDLGLLQERVYDTAGRLVTLRDGAGDESAFTWGALGELLSLTLPHGRVLQLSDYGEHGHATRVTDAGGSRLREYDAVGNLTRGDSLEGELGPGRPGVVSRSFDGDRNLTVAVLAATAGGLTILHGDLRIEYRSDGRRLAVRRPGGGDTEFVYDAHGSAVERRDRAGGAWRVTRIERDGAGRPQREDRPNGSWTTRRWDAAGRLERIAHGRGGEEESSLEIRWRDGRPEELVDPARPGPERFYYDAAGRVGAIQFPDGEWLQLGWDLRSRNSEEIYWYGGSLLRHLSHRYDAAGRLEEVLDGGALLVRRRHQAGRLVETETGNGLVRTWLYDPEDGLLAQTRTVDVGGALVEESGLTRDPLAGAFPGATWTATTQTFGALAATTEEQYVLQPAPGGPSGAGARVSGYGPEELASNASFYSYDELGNLQPYQSSRFIYGPEGLRLTRIEAPDGSPLHTYVWDEAGFAVDRDGVALGWTAAGRIARIEHVAEFSWDALGRLTASEVAGQVTLQRFGGRVQTDAAASAVAIERREVRIDLVAGEHRWRHFDFRGNPKFTSDVQGQVVAHRRYSPYGTREQLGSEADGPGFAQGLEIGELVVLGGRLYDPGAGRFLAPDPVFQVVNAYAYAQGNPVWLWDPDGRSAQAAITLAAGVGIAGMAAGAVVAGAVATPAALGIGLSLTLVSAGVTLGVITPYSVTAQTVAAGVATATAGVSGFLGASFPAGFALGQELQLAFEADFGAGVAPGGAGGGGPSSSGEAADDFGDIMIKVVEIDFEGPSEVSGLEGCSPVLAAKTAPDLSPWLLLLIPLQALLAWRAASR